MPLFDSRGQQIPYPVLTDKPNAQSAFQNLVEASVTKMVMTFASASVRGATLPNPTAGMVSWLSDVKRLEVFDGAAWVAFSVGTSVWKPLNLASGYTDTTDENPINNNQGPCEYRIVNLSGVDTVMFRGGFHIAYQSDGRPPNFDTKRGGQFTTTVLPSNVHPAFLRTIPLACSALNSTTSTVKLDIYPDGKLYVVGVSDTKDSPPWVSLNGAVCPL